MRYILKELFRHRLRTAFSILGYAIAALFILMLLSLGSSNNKRSLSILQNTGTHFIVYIPSGTSFCTSGKSDGYVFAEGVKTMMLDNDLLLNIKNGVKGVKDAAPCLLYKMYDQHFATDISIAGIDTFSIAAKSTTCSKTNLVAGKFISGDPGEIVAEQSFASAHGLDLGDTLEIFGGKMVLAGIVNSGIKPVKADFYSPISHVRTILKDRLQCNAPYFDMNIILVEAEDARVQDDVIAHIKNMMYRFTVSSYNCYEPAYTVMSIIDRTSALLTAVIFSFLVIFSAKTQLSSLTERFREIGVLKSLGWSDKSLSLQLLAISFIQAFTGVTLGAVAGTILIPVRNIAGQETVVQLQHIILLYTLSVGGAAMAVAFPVLKIYRSKAGDILRNYS